MDGHQSSDGSAKNPPAENDNTNNNITEIQARAYNHWGINKDDVMLQETENNDKEGQSAVDRPLDAASANADADEDEGLHCKRESKNIEEDGGEHRSDVHHQSVDAIVNTLMARNQKRRKPRRRMNGEKTQSHPVGGYTPGMFRDVSSIEEFAAALCVPVEAMKVAIPLDQPCKKEGCPFNQLKNNGFCCPAHRRTWYPLPHKCGGRMLGPEFMRPDPGKYSPLARCNCQNPSCFAIGYIPRDQCALAIPPAYRLTVLNTPWLFHAERKDEILADSRKTVRLAPWHFAPEDLEVVNGKWGFRRYEGGDHGRRDVFYRGDKQYVFPEPTQDFEPFLNVAFISNPSKQQAYWYQLDDATGMPNWIASIINTDKELFATGRGDDMLLGIAAILTDGVPTNRRGNLNYRDVQAVQEEGEKIKKRALEMQGEREQMVRKNNQQMNNLRWEFAKMEKEYKAALKKLQEDNWTLKHEGAKREAEYEAVIQDLRVDCNLLRRRLQTKSEEAENTKQKAIEMAKSKPKRQRTSKYHGVSYNKLGKKFASCFREKYLGLYTFEADAALSVDLAANLSGETVRKRSNFATLLEYDEARKCELEKRGSRIEAALTEAKERELEKKSLEIEATMTCSEIEARVATKLSAASSSDDSKEEEAGCDGHVEKEEEEADYRLSVC